MVKKLPMKSSRSWKKILAQGDPLEKGLGNPSGILAGDRDRRSLVGYSLVGVLSKESNQDLDEHSTLNTSVCLLIIRNYR